MDKLDFEPQHWGIFPLANIQYAAGIRNRLVERAAFRQHRVPVHAFEEGFDAVGLNDIDDLAPQRRFGIGIAATQLHVPAAPDVTAGILPSALAQFPSLFPRTEPSERIARQRYEQPITRKLRGLV